jgi:MFS family permease
VFVVGVAGFAAASLLCGAALSTGLLIGARALQGVAGALLVPGRLALLSATVPAAQRARWIAAWSGLTGAPSAVGPFAGGWLVDAASWRWGQPPAGGRGRRPGPGRARVRSRRWADAPRCGRGRHRRRRLAALAAGLIEAGEGWSATTGGLVVAGVAALARFWAARKSPRTRLTSAVARSRRCAIRSSYSSSMAGIVGPRRPTTS